LPKNFLSYSRKINLFELRLLSYARFKDREILMGPIDAVKTCFVKYVDFDGRAPRSEYWYFALFTLLLTSLSGHLDSEYGLTFTFGKVLSEQGITSGVINLLIFLPTVAVGVRRLHDIGKSGWWVLLPFTIIGIFVIIYWAAQISVDDNEYGKNPLIEDSIT